LKSISTVIFHLRYNGEGKKQKEEEHFHGIAKKQDFLLGH